MFVVLLTNRVHAARARRPAKVIADVRADLADAAALSVVESGDAVLRMPSSFRADRADGWNRSVRRSRKSRGLRKAHSTKTRTVAEQRMSLKKLAMGGKNTTATTKTRQAPPPRSNTSTKKKKKTGYVDPRAGNSKR